ncbi:GNAT family N-acetyltransferase [Amycolatopsis azurea]|uniref:GNAT family N-acetyltransferase n=1 Tax=Amycolatopsis azurea TaxID=36819 RepID=UPI003803E76F
MPIRRLGLDNGVAGVATRYALSRGKLSPLLHSVAHSPKIITHSRRVGASCHLRLARNQMTERQLQRDLSLAQAGRDFFVRPLVCGDLSHLMPQVGTLVDELYPQGADKLIRRLEVAASTHSNAFVVAHASHPRIPLALASEAAKGIHNLKLCTFWVAPPWRRRSLGRLLLETRVSSWLTADVNSVHVTVRHNRAQQLRPLFEKLGFRQVAVAAARYNGSDEVVLQWTPSWYSEQMEASIESHGSLFRRSA